MEFKKLTELVKAFEKATGNKYKLTLCDVDHKNPMAAVFDNGYVFYDTCTRDFTDLKQKAPLSMCDLKKYMNNSGRDMRYIQLAQRANLHRIDPKTNETEFEYIISRKFPITTVLDDFTTIADNLENFSWAYTWQPGVSSGFHYIPPYADVDMQGDLNDKILEFIQNQKVLEKEIFPVTHHSDKYMELLNLAEKVISTLE